MTWWQALPAVLTAIALLFIPGFALSRALGAKGFTSVALAPLASCGLVGVAGILGGILGIPWSVWLLIGVAIAAVATACLLYRFLRPRMAPVPASSASPILTWISVPVVVAVAAIIVAKRLLPAMGTPDSFAQVYDNIFHLNAIRYVLETGNASTLNLGNMLTSSSGINVYPSVWHSLAALIAQITDVNVFVAENALTLAVTAVLWPFACIALARTAVGPRIVPTVVSGVLAVGFWVFPYQTIQWGPLLPNTLSYSLLPLAVMVVAALFGLSRERIANHFTLSTMLAVGSAALLLTQPNGFSALLAFSVPIAAAFLIGAIRRALQSEEKTKRLLLIALWVLAATIVFVVVWQSMLLGYDDWKPSRKFLQSIKDVATGGLLGKNFTWLASMLAAAGLATIFIRRKGGWIIGAMAVAGVLYVAASWAQPGPFRHILTGSWYQDPYRLAALVPLFTIVLAAMGADGIASLVIRLTKRVSKNLRPFAPNISAAGGIVILALLLTAFVPLSLQANHKGLDVVTEKISKSWSFNPGWVVSLPEYELMKRLDDHVPADAVIGVDPFNGGSLAYAVSGRKVSQYHLNPPPSKELLDVATNIDSAAKGSETCTLADKLGIDYILDFGSFYMLDVKAAKIYPAFVEVRDENTLKLVDQQDHAKLYKIVGC